MSKKNRYHLIDSVRGLAVVNMVVFHFLYDVFIIYKKNPAWYGTTSIHIWQQSIAWTFIFVSGFVWQWGKKNSIKRGIELNIFGILITIVTVLAIPDSAVRFGILNCLGCLTLIMIVVDKLIGKSNQILCFIIFIILFAIFKDVQHGVIGIEGIYTVKVSGVLYDIKPLTIFGFPYDGFESTDYFPIMPWFFLFGAGYCMNLIVMKYDAVKNILKFKIPVLNIIGNKSVWIYLLHQPICMLICIIIFDLV